MTASTQSAAYVEHKETLGAWFAQFIADETPLAAAVAGGLYNHFAPALIQAFVPADVIEGAIKKTMGALSSALSGQVIALSVPSGILSDVMTHIENAVPGFLRTVENAADPYIVAAMKAIGVVTVPKAA